MENLRLWGRVIRDHRIVSSETIPMEEGDFESALRELCRRLDLPRPVQLPKNDRDLSAFSRTFYGKEHFLEPISFQRLEVEILSPEGEKRGSARRTPLTDA